MRILAVVALIVTFAAGQALAADWPQFRGPDGTGISSETGLNKDWGNKPPQVLWRVSLSDNGYAGPSAAAGKVYIVDHEGDQDILRCLDLQTGGELWRYSYPEPGKFDYGFCRTTPTVNEGKVYVWSRGGQALCLKADTGTPIWTRNLMRELGGKAPGWSFAASPVIDGDRVIFTPGGNQGNTVVLNKETGDTIWRGGTGDVPGHATPVVAQINGVKTYVVMTSSSLTGLDAATGKALWRTPFENKAKVNAASPVVVPPYIFITTGYGFGCQLVGISPQGPQVLWQNTNMQAHFSSPIYYNNVFFGTTDPGNLICLNPKDGSVLWSRGGFEKGGIMIADGVIIGLCGKTGELVMAKATYEGYQELGRIVPLGGQSWTAPILADGKLIIRNTKTLACLDMK
jgi:outer membrane protein assembly factor BamB